MAEKKTRTAAGKIETKKPPPETTYTPEEALIGAALTIWEDAAPLDVTHDLFSDPTLLRIWKAIGKNPEAGIPGLHKELQPRAFRCIELYNGEDPGALLSLLREARNQRALQTTGEILSKPKADEPAATTWDRAEEHYRAATPTPATEVKRWKCKELIDAKLPEPTWIVPNLLPAGITLLAGGSKTGKSWLALKWAGLIPINTIYLGYEDIPSRLQERIARLNINSDTLTSIAGPPWRMPQALNELVPDVNGNGPSMIIADPWALFGPSHQDNNRIFDVDYESLGTLRRWTEKYDVSVLIVHHTRKPTGSDRGDPLHEPLGSTALTAAVDTDAILKRSNDRESTLHIRGRDIEAQDLLLTFDEGLWEIAGHASEATLAGGRGEILAVLRETPEPLIAADVARRLGQDPNSVRVVLNRMYSAEQITKDDQGRYGVTLVTPVTVEGF